VVELLPSSLTSMDLEADDGLEGFESLYCAFEADRSRFDLMSDGGLCHDCANEVV